MKANLPKQMIIFMLTCTTVLSGKFLVAAPFFGIPVNLGQPVNSAYDEGGMAVTPDGLTLYFSSNRPGGYGDHDLYVTTRLSINDPWTEPVNLGSEVNTDRSEGWCSLTADGLVMLFSELTPGTIRPGGVGGRDLWMMTRASTATAWANPVNLGPSINSSGDDLAPSLLPDGLTLVFTSDRSGGWGARDLWYTTRSSRSDPWGAVLNLGPQVNSSSVDSHPSLSPDGRVLFFDSMRNGNYSLYVTTRLSEDQPWVLPQSLGSPVNSSYLDGAPLYWAGAQTLLFASERPGTGGIDFWQAPILSIVDFNGNGSVDIRDLLKLIECWGQSDLKVDIGPAIVGDGIVDAVDLDILMGYWGQEVDDPTLLACWKLDEIEGNIAYDSARENDADVLGNAAWAFEEGIVDGAIQLDGMNAYIRTSSVLDPATVEFSVFIWIKGGQSGQTIMSQDGASDWLLTDTQGCLVTALISGGRQPGQPLSTEVVVTDGNWHRIGLVWDRSYRSLYVDDELAVMDVSPQNNFPSSQGGLHIGAANNLQSGTFWSGLIDDVRIYDRVVEP